MKRFICTTVLAFICSIVLLACSNSTSTPSPASPQLHSNIVPMFDIQAVSEECKLEGTIIEGNSKNEIQEVFKELCDFYGITKELPEIRKVSADEFLAYTGGIPMMGCYDYRTQKLYILDIFSIKNDNSKEVLVHELLHYLSDNGEKRGYVKKDGSKELNKYFNEGVTEYLAQKFMKKQYLDTPYLYQMSFVEELAIIFGDDVLENGYFQSDDSILREKFNNAVYPFYQEEKVDNVKYDAFDYFSSSFYTLWYLGVLDKIPEQCAGFSALQEEIIFAAMSEGKTSDVQNYFKHLFTKDLQFDNNFLNQFFKYNYLIALK